MSHYSCRIASLNRLDNRHMRSVVGSLQSAPAAPPDNASAAATESAAANTLRHKIVIAPSGKLGIRFAPRLPITRGEVARRRHRFVTKLYPSRHRASLTNARQGVCV